MMPANPALGPAVASVAICLGLLATACAGATTQVSPTAVPATSAPATTAPPSPATPRPAAASPAASPIAGDGAPAAPAAKPAADGGVRLTLAQDGSEARFRAREQLAGRSLPNDAVGATRGVTGSILLAPNGAPVPAESKLTVDLRSLRSDENRRDNWIQRNTLQTDQFPTAELVPREVSGLPNPLPTSGEATFQLVGELTVHGVTRPTTWETTARFADREVTGTATTRVKMTDFGMTPPRVGPVLSIEDELALEVDFRATRDPGPSAGGGEPRPDPALGPA
jgi:polyisoprenoid-binding protein YceI